MDRAGAAQWFSQLSLILTVEVADYSRYRLPRGKAFTLL
jgi:hypothetical protein